MSGPSHDELDLVMDDLLLQQKVSEMLRLYGETKVANVGDVVRCPGCGKEMVKLTYHHTFCSNYKTRGVRNCKDAYWNTAEEDRRERALRYKK